MLLRSNTSKSWIEISKKSLLHNLGVFQKIVDKDTKIAVVVKANAYGHGINEVVSVLRNKVEIFAVDNVDEALAVRKLDSNKKVIILGYSMPANLKKTIEKKFSFVVYDIKILKYIVSLKSSKKALVHIKIETGLNRQGVEGNELLGILNYIKKYQKYIFLEGVYTHFANVEDTLNTSYAEQQLKRFGIALKMVHKEGFNPPLVHTAASAATLLFEKSHFSMIRMGIGLYGLWPSRETKISRSSKKVKISLMPVLSWKSIVAQVKDLKKGESVGYGRTWFAQRKSKIAIVPVGYSDGYDRKLSNNGKVVVEGSFAQVIGRVAMNMIMVDVTDIKNVKAGVAVMIIGSQGEKQMSADEIAEKIGTINYEVVSRINALLPRKII